MAYSELIKSFEKIRGYMREFYVYGFKSREEYDRKSSRSYDNEKRRIESWLGEYMSFRRDSGGKAVFLSVDNRNVSRNPLYRAFKAKSFTDKDIMLHFYLLDILSEDEPMSIRDIVESISRDYLAQFDVAHETDESTVRKKLKEYEALGIVKSSKRGRTLCYSKCGDSTDPGSWRDAIDFFSESDPMGVIGSYLQDRLPEQEARFSFKHHYLLHALDSEVLWELLQAIREHRAIELTSFAVRKNELREHTVLPLKIYISTQNGRQYLLAYHYRLRRPMFFRMDNIRKVSLGNVEKRMDKYGAFHDIFRQNLWGVSTGVGHSIDHIEISIRVSRNEGYILDRLEREKRCGRIEPVDEHTYKFTADVYDAAEMLPWIRTFTGRIVKLECSNAFVVKRFTEDIAAMRVLYGGESNAVQ